MSPRADPYSRFGRIVLVRAGVTAGVFALGAWLTGHWHDLFWVVLLIVFVVFQAADLALRAARGKPPFDDLPD